MTDTITDTVDPYEHIGDDHDLWLATPPPAQFGPAIHTVLRDINALTDGQRAAINTHYTALLDRSEAQVTAAAEDLDEQLFEHPIGGSNSCVGTTDISTWSLAVHLRVGEGPSYVLQAVAARDHGLIPDPDFALLTGWWVEAGMTLPDPISDTDRAALVAWWDEQG